MAKIKPLLVVCYLCGHQYGSKSILIHLPFCLKRFIHTEGIKDRLALPEPPRAKIGTKQYNQQATTIYKEKVLKPCPSCKRTFFPESLAKHIISCVKDQPRKPMDYRLSFKQPAALVCFFCGDRFGCLQKIDSQKGRKC